MLAHLRALIRAESGATAVFFGLAVPVLIGGAGAAIEYVHLARDKAALQAAADSAALTAARELTLANADDARAITVAKSVAGSALSQQAGIVPAISAQVLDNHLAVAVAIDAEILSYFGKLMSMPTMQLHATATARLSGSTKLCVIALDPSSGGTVRLDKYAKLTADACSVQSNSKDAQGLTARDFAYLKAQRVCSSGGYDGRAGSNISPTPITDCPPIDDPLVKRPAPSAGGCDYTNTVVNRQTVTLSPGVYCGGLKIGNGAQVTLREGTYIIDGAPLTVNSGATLQGDYVGFYFRGDLATLSLASDSTISLSAPKVGSMAGILFFEDRSAPLLRTFAISSDNARKLLGTIYLPRGMLSVDANNPVADQSAYTVIVSRQLRLSAGPNLVLNANYSSTDVPVPDGVGPLGAKVSLSQ